MTFILTESGEVVEIDPQPSPFPEDPSYQEDAE
jgi:hypothetical protein